MKKPTNAQAQMILAIARANVVFKRAAQAGYAGTQATYDALVKSGWAAGDIERSWLTTTGWEQAEKARIRLGRNEHYV